MAAPRVQAAQKQGGGLPGISAGGEGVGGLLQAVVSQCVGFRNDPLRLQGGQVLSEGVQLVSSRVKERGPSPESKERAVTSLSWST